MDPEAISKINELSPGLILLIGFIGLVINTFILSYAANYLNLNNADFGRCFVVCLASTIIGTIFRVSSISFGWIVSAIITILLIRLLLTDSLWASILTYIVMVVVTILLACGLGALFATGACICVPLGS
jgi:hypothetical protein